MQFLTSDGRSNSTAGVTLKQSVLVVRVFQFAVSSHCIVLECAGNHGVRSFQKLRPALTVTGVETRLRFKHPVEMIVLCDEGSLRLLLRAVSHGDSDTVVAVVGD